MTGLNTHSNSEERVPYYISHFCGPRGLQSLQLSQSSPALDSRFTWRQLLSWQALLRATLLAIGLAYGTSALLAEFEYVGGLQEHTAGEAVVRLRRSAELFPLDHRFRDASALYLGDKAMIFKDPQWEAAALPELYHALRFDPTSPDLLRYVRMFEHAPR